VATLCVVVVVNARQALYNIIRSIGAEYRKYLELVRGSRKRRQGEQLKSLFPFSFKYVNRGLKIHLIFF
jgi:hypothetical protein